MSDPTKLVPADVMAAAYSYKRLSIAFGERFFTLLLIGLVWIVPAFFNRRFVFALLAWDVLVLLAWLADLAQLPQPAQLSVRRTWHSPAALSIPSTLGLVLLNSSARTVHATMIDTVPSQLRIAPPTLTVKVPAHSEAVAAYEICPSERGDARLGDCYVQYQSIFRIAERWVRASVAQTVRIYPNLEEAKRDFLEEAARKMRDSQPFH